MQTIVIALAKNVTQASAALSPDSLSIARTARAEQPIVTPMRAAKTFVQEGLGVANPLTESGDGEAENERRD